VQERYLQQLRSSCIAAWHNYFRSRQQTIQQYRQRIMLSTVRLLGKEKERLVRYLPQRLRNGALGMIVGQKHRLELLNARLQLLNPENILRRGYSITMVNGQTLRSVQQVHAGDTLRTILADGEVSSEVLSEP